MCFQPQNSSTSPPTEARSSWQRAAVRVNCYATRGETAQHPTAHDASSPRRDVQLAQVSVRKLHQDERATEAWCPVPSEGLRRMQRLQAHLGLAPDSCKAVQGKVLPRAELHGNSRAFPTAEEATDGDGRPAQTRNESRLQGEALEFLITRCSIQSVRVGAMELKACTNLHFKALRRSSCFLWHHERFPRKA